MKIVEGIEQDTELWHEWRRGGLGASDSKAVASGSESIRKALWAVKTGAMPESAFQDHFADYWRDRGKELEPAARAMLQSYTGKWIEPALAYHEEHQWLRASLDGIDDSGIPYEIKCPGKIKHNRALGGSVPSEYFHQNQHALLVTGAPCLGYWSFDGEDGVLIEVLPDLEYQRKYLERAKHFWAMVESRTEPSIEAALRASINRKRGKSGAEIVS